MRLRLGHVVRIVALGLPALLFAPVSAAQNLVPNGTFDTNIQGWTASLPYGEAWWLASDSLGASTSGAMRVGSIEMADGNGAYSDCLPVANTPTGYVYGAFGYVPTQAGAGEGRINIITYNSLAECQAGAWFSSQYVTIDTPTWSLAKSTFNSGSYIRVYVEARTASPDKWASFVADNLFVCPFEAKGDLDADRLPDLLLRQGSTGYTYLWTMKDATRVAQAPLSPQPDSGLFAPALVGSDDFDRNGSSDLVFQPTFSTALTFWFMLGPTRYGTATLSGPLPTLGWVVVATGDFNHDGWPDLLWRNSSTQQLQVTTLNGTTITGTLIPNPAQAVDANWRVVAALDYNADGNRDLLWYNDTTGKIVFWFLDQNMVRITGQFANPASAGDANWKVVAGGDYGFGASGMACKNDIVWRNDTSGRLVVWHMDSAGNRVAGAFITPDPSPNAADWTVLGPR